VAAKELVSRRPGLLTLRAEVLAACQPLPETATAQAASEDAESAVLEYQKLVNRAEDWRQLHVESTQQAQMWQQRHAEARAALEQARESVEMLRAARLEIEGRAKSAESRAREGVETCTRLQAQLDEQAASTMAAATQQRRQLDELFRVQERLESALERARDAEARCDAAQETAAASRQRADEVALKLQALQTELEQQRAGLRQQLDERSGELARLRSELEAARSQAQDAERLQQRLQEHEETTVRLKAECVALQQAMESRNVELARARSDLEAGRRQWSDLSLARSVAEAARDQALADASQALSSRRQMQVLALDATRRWQIEQNSGPGALMVLDPQSPGSCTTGRLQWQHEQGDTVHRHLAGELLAPATPAGRFERLGLRLLHHRGRVGIALIKSESQTPPLAAWESHAREGDRELCLLIPGDPRSRMVWQRLAAEDWRFISTLAIAMEESVVERQDAWAGFWGHAARQLRMQLSQLPPRLRYDGVEVFGDVGANDRVVVRIEFRRAVFGHRELGTLSLLWRPDAGHSLEPAEAALALQRDPRQVSESPPLSSWPIGMDGQWAPSVALPVGGGLAPRASRLLWGQLLEHDRQLILALLDAMPAARERLGATDTPIPAQTATVGEAARQLHRQARRTVLGLQWRRALRAALRR
jgi:hypothetical protein